MHPVAEVWLLAPEKPQEGFEGARGNLHLHAAHMEAAKGDQVSTACLLHGCLSIATLFREMFRWLSRNCSCCWRALGSTSS